MLVGGGAVLLVIRAIAGVVVDTVCAMVLAGGVAAAFIGSVVVDTAAAVFGAIIVGVVVDTVCATVLAGGVAAAFVGTAVVDTAATVFIGSAIVILISSAVTTVTCRAVAPCIAITVAISKQGLTKKNSSPRCPRRYTLPSVVLVSHAVATVGVGAIGTIRGRAVIPNVAVTIIVNKSELT